MLPKIISVDDHVVEPPHVWQTWLPEKYRGAGPAGRAQALGRRSGIMPGARYEMTEDPDGLWGDAWYYDDKLIYVHKRFVAIPLEATPDGDLTKFDRTKMVMTAVTYDEMRPGLLRPRRAHRGLRAQLGRRFAAVPDVPALLRADVLRGRRPGARARVRAGVQRLDGRGVVRAVAAA